MHLARVLHAHKAHSCCTHAHICLCHNHFAKFTQDLADGIALADREQLKDNINDFLKKVQGKASGAAKL